MKVKVKGEESQQSMKQKFPALMISKEDGAVVLFLASCSGVELHGGRIFPNRKAHFDTRWNMDVFVPFVGKVTISND